MTALVAIMTGAVATWLAHLAAQAIEARRAETGTGSVHESAVGEADAPETSGTGAES
jgi:hypothetical protein